MILTFAALIAASAPAAGQVWSAEAVGGRARSEVGPSELTASTAALTLRWDALRAWVAGTAGIPLDETDPFWGVLSGGLEGSRRAGPFSLGFEGAAYLFAQDDRTTPDEGLLDGPTQRRHPDLSGGGTSGELTPYLGIGRGFLRLQVRATGALYHASFGDLDETRTLLAPGLRALATPAPGITLAPEAGLVLVEGDELPLLGATAVMARGRLSLWGTASHFAHDTVSSRTSWSGGVGLRLTDRIRLLASASRDGYAPLYGSPERTSWSAGLRIRLGGDAGGALRAPTPESYEDGRATLRLDGRSVPQGAGVPRVAGTFNEWTPVPMRPDGDGWSIALDLEAGVYHYSFVTEDGVWFVPESTPGRIEDGFGGWVATLVVEGGT